MVLAAPVDQVSVGGIRGGGAVLAWGVGPHASGRGWGRARNQEMLTRGHWTHLAQRAASDHSHQQCAFGDEH